MNTWQTAELDLQAAWQLTKGTPRVVVAIVDTGVQADHPALVGHLLPGYDVLTGSAGARDDNGHGTALAGIVAATCPACEILPVKVLDQTATGDSASIAAGVIWAVDHGARIVDLSVGATRATDALRGAVGYAVSKGAIVVAAAGNDGLDEPYYPAAYPGVVAVAGVDQNLARYSWSNFGSWVTVAAPGCAATSALGGGTIPDFCGTSTAAPFVAGIAGLALAYRPDLGASGFLAALRTAGAPLPDPGVAALGCVDANRLLIDLGAPAGPPSLSAPPSIPRRTPVVGASLTPSIGTWQGGSRYSVEWQRSRDGRAWRDVVGARVYRPTLRDVGYRLRIVVTADNARGATTAVSTATAAVRRRPNA